MNPYYASACRSGMKESLPEELLQVLGPLMPRYDNFVRVTSWPRFDEPETSIPFEQRSLDVPAKQMRPRTAKEISKGRPYDSEWYLCAPTQQTYAESGPGVVPRSTAAKDGHNSSGYMAQVPILRQPGILRNLSLPLDFTGPPHSDDEDLQVAPENWIACRTIQCSSSPPQARYPPLNYYNALHRRPPREKRNIHKFRSTYPEPLFSVISGTCTYSASQQLAAAFEGRLSEPVSGLNLYKAVRSEMNLADERDLDEFLQLRAKKGM